MVQWNFIYSRLILYNVFSGKFMLQGHNVQTSSKYRKEIGQKISVGHNSLIADEIMNQVRRATDYLRNRTNIRTLSNSKFHQGKSYHWIFFVQQHIFICVCFLFGVMTLLGQHYADITRSNTYHRACGTVGIDGISSACFKKALNAHLYSFCLSTIHSPVLNKLNFLKNTDPVTNLM